MEISKNTKTKSILFISAGIVSQEAISFINDVLNDLIALNYEVLLRPHPSELYNVQEKYSCLIEQGVKIDKLNLYEILKKTEIVVGLYPSTVLYEAVYFSKKVYMMNTKFTAFYEPNSCFILFVNKNDFIALIKNETILNYDSNYFWDSNWKKNYINFIENTIGIKNAN